MWDVRVDAAGAAFETRRLVPAPSGAEIGPRGRDPLQAEGNAAHETTREMGKVLDQTLAAMSRKPWT